ncbi:hypothetical protein [Priestia megaterium]|uniref:hypothetical protein n=1 Tax=Priestia megaterium TaxID=1404 RepID=UPI003CC5E61C
MVTMKVYIDTEGFCWIVNGLNKALEYEWGKIHKVSLKKTKKFPYEVYVPIQIIGQFVKKNETTINLYKLQQLNKESV